MSALAEQTPDLTMIPQKEETPADQAAIPRSASIDANDQTLLHVCLSRPCAHFWYHFWFHYYPGDGLPSLWHAEQLGVLLVHGLCREWAGDGPNK
jgi:hypothetical protein